MTTNAELAALHVDNIDRFNAFADDQLNYGLSVLPSTFDLGRKWFTNDQSGKPSNCAAAIGSIVNAAGVGQVLQMIGDGAGTAPTVYQRGYMPIIPGNVYRARTRARQTVDNTTGASRLYHGIACYAEDWSFLGNIVSAAEDGDLTVAEGWRTFTRTATAAVILSTYPTAVFVRSWVRPNCDTLGEEGNGTAQIKLLELRCIETDLIIATGVYAGQLHGMTLANNVADATNDIDFGAGSCTDSTATYFITCAALTKRLDAAWSVGNNAGGLDTGAIANGTYHCFAIRKDSDGSGDFLFSASATTPTMPTGYTYFRRVGSIIRESAAIVLFTQEGDHFYRTQVASYQATPADNNAFTITLHTPLGIITEALLGVAMNDPTPAANTGLLLSPLALADANPLSSPFPFTISIIGAAGKASIPDNATGQARVLTNASAQIRGRMYGRQADHSVFITTIGWRDSRGRLG